jgi:hypothetical protein
MARVSRRSVVKTFVAVGAWLGIGERHIAAQEYLEAVSPRPEDAPSQLALKWMRTFNTAQMSYRRAFERFAEIGSLPAAPILLDTGKELPDPPEGFDLLFELALDGQTYFTVVRSRATGFAYRSSEVGVIFEGTVASVNVARRDREFGAPISPTTLPRAQVSPFARVVQSSLAFFFPTLDARQSDCPMFGCGTCVSSCYCPYACCNWGTKQCVWCCAPQICCS